MFPFSEKSIQDKAYDADVKKVEAVHRAESNRLPVINKQIEPISRQLGIEQADSRLQMIEVAHQLVEVALELLLQPLHLCPLGQQG